MLMKGTALKTRHLHVTCMIFVRTEWQACAVKSKSFFRVMLRFLLLFRMASYLNIQVTKLWGAAKVKNISACMHIMNEIFWLLFTTFHSALLIFRSNVSSRSLIHAPHMQNGSINKRGDIAADTFFVNYVYTFLIQGPSNLMAQSKVRQKRRRPITITHF